MTILVVLIISGRPSIAALIILVIGWLLLQACQLKWPNDRMCLDILLEEKHYVDSWNHGRLVVVPWWNYV